MAISKGLLDGGTPAPTTAPVLKDQAPAGPQDIADPYPQDVPEPAATSAATGAAKTGISKGLLEDDEGDTGTLGKLGTTTGNFAKSAVGGAAHGGGMFMGGKLGFEAGVMAAPFGGPFAPFVIGGATLLGIAGGYWAGDQFAKGLEQQDLAISDPMDLPEGQRGAGIAGEAFGGGMAGTGAIMGIARTGARLPASGVGRLINPMLERAASPGWKATLGLTSVETTANLIAGTAEGVYENYRPGHPLERALVGMTAGFFDPKRVGLAFSRGLSNRVSRVMSKWTTGARMSTAARTLQEYLQEAGDDPEVLAHVLAQKYREYRRVAGDVTGTAGQITGERAFIDLEKTLGEAERPFGEQLLTQADDVLDAYSGAIQLLKGEGSPAALKEVAAMRIERFKYLFTKLSGRAETDLAEAVTKISRENSPNRVAELSRGAAEAIYDKVLVRARDVESKLWADAFEDHLWPAQYKTFKRVVAGFKGKLSAGADDMPSEIQSHLDRVLHAEQLMEEANTAIAALPPGARQVIPKEIADKMAQAQEMLSVGELMKARSSLLGAAKEAMIASQKVGGGRGKGPSMSKRASMFGAMASALLDDLTAAGAASKMTANGRIGPGGRFISEGAETPYDVARAYTKSLEDTFTRSFVGAAQRETAFGVAIPAELMLTKALAVGDDATMLRLNEIDDAVKFLGLPKWNLAEKAPAILEEVAGASEVVFDAQSRILRIMADRARSGGEFTQRNLQSFMARAADLLDRFPAVKADLDAALASRKQFDNWAGRIKGLETRLFTQGPAAKLMGVDSVSAALRGVVTSGQPVTGLDNMLSLAKIGKVVPSLRAGIWSFVADASTGADGRMDPRRFVQMLRRPMDTDLPSLMEWMQANKVIPEDAAEHVDNLVDMIDNVANAISTRATGDLPDLEAGVIEKTLISMMGSVTGRAALKLVTGGDAGGAVGGPTLIVAGKSAQAAQTLLNRMPVKAVQRLFMDALRGEPKPGSTQPFSLLQELLTRSADEAAEIRKAFMLHSYAWQAGLLGAQDEYDYVTGSRERPDNQAGLDLDNILRDVSNGRTMRGKMKKGLGQLDEELRQEKRKPVADPGGDEGAADDSSFSLISSAQAAPRPPKDKLNYTKPKNFTRLSKAVEQVESGGDEKAASPKGALGPMQVMPDTLKDPGYGVKPAKDNSPAENRRVGRQLLKAFLKKYGSLDYALVAYNWGPGNANKWIEQGADYAALPDETQKYIKKVRKRL